MTAGDISPPAERTRRRRSREKDRVVRLRIELRDTEVDRLADIGYLRHAQRNDLQQIRDALYWFLDRTLGSAG